MRKPSSKFPSISMRVAPCTTAWAIFPAAILPAGRITAQPIPAREAYAAAEAEELPVEAHTTISATSMTDFEDAADIPRSLVGQVGLVSSYVLTMRTSVYPIYNE